MLLVGILRDTFGVEFILLSDSLWTLRDSVGVEFILLSDSLRIARGIPLFPLKGAEKAVPLVLAKITFSAELGVAPQDEKAVPLDFAWTAFCREVVVGSPSCGEELLLQHLLKLLKSFALCPLLHTPMVDPRMLIIAL